MISSFLLVLATQALPAAAITQDVDEPDPKAMSQAEIKTFNAKVSRAHPYYIRCERRLETGSLVKKLTSCRTNEQWKQSDDTGNDAAREAGDHFRPKFLSQSG